MPQISVVLPAYNAAATIDESVASILAQTFSDFELIAIDDGSSDATLVHLKRWASQDQRVRIIENQHGGVISAANAGLHAAQGALIARMDADDRMHPQRLEKQIELLTTYPEIDVASCWVTGIGKVRQGFKVYMRWLNGLCEHEAIAREMFVESVIPNPTVLFRREVLSTVGYFEDRGWPEDYDYWLRAYLAGVKFGKVPMDLHEWREHEERLTRTDSRYSVKNFIRVKTHYMMQGPAHGRDAVIIWGAGMMGRRFSKHLERAGGPVVAFIDVDPNKIGNTRRGKPIIAHSDLMAWWGRYQNPIVLAAVGARGARQLIRAELNGMGLVEGRDWWGVA